MIYQSLSHQDAHYATRPHSPRPPIANHPVPPHCAKDIWESYFLSISGPNLYKTSTHLSKPMATCNVDNAQPTAASGYRKRHLESVATFRGSSYYVSLFATQPNTKPQFIARHFLSNPSPARLTKSSPPHPTRGGQSMVR